MARFLAVVVAVLAGAPAWAAAQAGETGAALSAPRPSGAAAATEAAAPHAAPVADEPEAAGDAGATRDGRGLAPLPPELAELSAPRGTSVNLMPWPCAEALRSRATVRLAAWPGGIALTLEGQSALLAPWPE